MKKSEYSNWGLSVHTIPANTASPRDLISDVAPGAGRQITLIILVNRKSPLLND
jgi:hypothetical protein